MKLYAYRHRDGTWTAVATWRRHALWADASTRGAATWAAMKRAYWAGRMV